MLVVKVELHSARTGKVTLLGKMVIALSGVPEDPRRGHYDVWVSRKANVNKPFNQHKPLRTGEVLNYPRHSYNVWRLVSRALRSAFPEEK
jgi:hypothetical protein